MIKPNWKKQVAPELAPLAAKFPSFAFGPLTSGLIRLLGRVVKVPASTDAVSVRAVSVGSREAHLYTPTAGARADGALLWIHGGGRIIGRPFISASTCHRLAESLGVIVVAAEYRLAPPHPFPAALDDCHATWLWLLENAEELGVSPDRIVVGGESAGGGLAAELTQRIYDEGGVQPVGQALVYPMLDDRTAARADLTAQKHLLWNNDSNRYAWSSYLGRSAGTADLPPYAAAARREDLSGLPPAWITVGTLDLFVDEDRAYADRLSAAGVPVTFELIEGGFHGVFSMGRDEAPVARVWASLEAFLNERFAPG